MFAGFLISVFLIVLGVLLAVVLACVFEDHQTRPRLSTYEPISDIPTLRREKEKDIEEAFK